MVNNLLLNPVQQIKIKLMIYKFKNKMKKKKRIKSNNKFCSSKIIQNLNSFNIKI